MLFYRTYRVTARRNWDTPLPIFSSHFFLAGSNTGAEREASQGRAFCARRVSGRSEAQSLDWPPALRTLPAEKMRESHRDLVADAVGLVVLLHLGCLLRGWLDLQPRWLLLLPWHCCALRHITAQIAREFAFVVGVDFGVVLSARDRHVSHAAVHQLLA